MGCKKICVTAPPMILMELLVDKDEAKSQRLMKAMIEMDKIDIAALEKAYAGKYRTESTEFSEFR